MPNLKIMFKAILIVVLLTFTYLPFASAVPITWTTETYSAESTYHGNPIYTAAALPDIKTSPPIPLDTSSAGTLSGSWIGWSGDGSASAHAESGYFSASTSSVGAVGPWNSVSYHAETTAADFNVLNINVTSWYYYLNGLAFSTTGYQSDSGAALDISVSDLSSSSNLFTYSTTRHGAYFKPIPPGYGSHPVIGNESFLWNVPLTLNSNIAIDITLKNYSAGYSAQNNITANGNTNLSFGIDGTLNESLLTSPVPEPSTILLLLGGLAGIMIRKKIS